MVTSENSSGISGRPDIEIPPDDLQRTTPAPKLDKAAQEKLEVKGKELAPKYRTEMLTSA